MKKAQTKTQEQKVAEKLLKCGKCSSNFFKERGVKCLSKVICKLKAKGMDIEGVVKESKKGRDYIYILKSLV